MFLTLFGVPGTGTRVEFDFAAVAEWEFAGYRRLVCLSLT
ncbi:hypothetical protein BCF44_11816 [Kutzneria buriramensis]|uniref:Uncharacterized protein n=1 Tax=Kutzneria buriramensis TaxID=1045776 RepID=A0A3E0GYY2_9PSEU|nr:hypothetical protein BCF44_11816 [Kutzneria buriramensis]